MIYFGFLKVYYFVCSPLFDSFFPFLHTLHHFPERGAPGLPRGKLKKLVTLARLTLMNILPQ